MADTIEIRVNEEVLRVDADTTLYALRDRLQKRADVLVYNGAPVSEDLPLRGGDCVVLIERGGIPSPEALAALMRARHTPGIYEKIREAVVGIAGAGGLGSVLAERLARLGTGKLVVADYDVVEPSNLNRQQYFIDQIGMRKVAALRANLKRINPYMAIETHDVEIRPDNIRDIFGGVDVMAEALDRAETKAMFTGGFLRQCPEIPLVTASGMAGHGPSNTIQTRVIRKNLVMAGDGETGTEPGRGLMAPRVGIAACHQANAILRILTGETPE
jgi:sulfur carrier protein ThiS adenylyltransferase